VDGLSPDGSDLDRHSSFGQVISCQKPKALRGFGRGYEETLLMAVAPWWFQASTEEITSNELPLVQTRDTVSAWLVAITVSLPEQCQQQDKRAPEMSTCAA